MLLALLALSPARAEAQSSTQVRAMAASSLPRLASDLRDQGTDPGDLAEALDAMHHAGIPADVAAAVLKAEFEARTLKGRAQVRLSERVSAQLAKGVRGAALAKAVTASPPEPRVKRRDL